LEAVADDAVRIDRERGDGHGPNALETQSQHADSRGGREPPSSTTNKGRRT
jgi:hypothetical protein